MTSNPNFSSRGGSESKRRRNSRGKGGSNRGDRSGSVVDIIIKINFNYKDNNYFLYNKKKY